MLGIGNAIKRKLGLIGDLQPTMRELSCTVFTHQLKMDRPLGLTVRSVRRLVRQLREGGGNSLIRRSRSDRGAARIGEERQRFIVKTYRDGNCGSRRLRPAQWQWG